MDIKKTSQNKLILIAESFVPAREIISEIIDMLGYEHKHVTNGFQLILELKKRNTSLILLDLELSQYNGFEAIEHIRRKLDYPKNTVPVIAMVNKDFSSNFNDTYKEEGFDDIIVKPFSLDDLTEKIESVLLKKSEKETSKKTFNS